MHNNTVFETIRTLCIEKEDPEFYDLDQVYTAVAHGYYFVRPGKNTNKFMNELVSAFVKGAKLGAKNFERDNLRSSSMACYLWVSVAKQMLKVVRKFFDREFFEAQSTLIPNDEFDSDTLLTTYLNMMNPEQLLVARRLFDLLSYEYDLFYIDSTNYAWRVLVNMCHDVDSSVPTLGEDVLKLWEFNKDHPGFPFDYLDNITVANSLNTLITKDRTLAANMIRALYYTNDMHLCIDYTSMIHNLERMCDAHPFLSYSNPN
jgi:hypothetical protein